MKTEIPETIRSIYFIGIAGIGMSALARYFKNRDVKVAGYDADRSALAETLQQEGMDVHFTEEESILLDTPDLVVYTPAVPDTHKGLMHYRSIGVPVVKRSQVLGWISNRHKCIAVAGTHGKTTTSAFITQAMLHCGEDVTAFLGGLVQDLGGNFVEGKSEWLIAEADEYDRSFHALSPEIAVVTAMDADHLDIYGDYKEMVAGYVGFIRKTHSGGIVILHEGVKEKLDAQVIDELYNRDIKVYTFGVRKADYTVTSVKPSGSGVQFELRTIHSGTLDVNLQMPGLHNALNSSVALTICDLLDLNVAKAAEGLSKFSGIKRRFEVVFQNEKHTIIDDYAHHPEELEAAISAARLQYAGKKITGVFQPHLYSRTKDFYKEFARSLDALDTRILVELYPARELPIEGVSSKMIYDEMKNGSKHLTTKKELIPLLVSLDPEVLLLLGAGDLDRMVPEIIENLVK
jgi:UDP-N-acetylmuramate--alanine ligase